MCLILQGLTLANSTRVGSGRNLVGKNFIFHTIRECHLAVDNMFNVDHFISLSKYVSEREE